MKSVIVAWCKTNERDFERQVPLQFVGQRNRVLGFDNDIQILFLDGYENISTGYKNNLTELGYTLHDGQKIYQELVKKYHVLKQFGDFETKCFLRWPALRAYFSGEKIIHYDGDIVFNEAPSVISQKISDLTFVLQGCPAFTAISTPNWFACYQQELDAFVSNIENYSASAWQQRTGWDISFRTRWAGSRFRKIITSDQDFLSHLIHTGLIQQDPIHDVMTRLHNYALFENPILIDYYVDGTPFTYSRKNGIDYLTSQRIDAADEPITKRVLLWHMQSCFNFYAAKYIIRRRLLAPLSGTHLKLDLSARNFDDWFAKKIARISNWTTRLSVYNYFFKEHDFSDLLSEKVWWKPGVFDKKNRIKE